MDRDRNLLFGVFAVQLKKATSSQIMAAAGAWAADQSKDLPARLLENHALSSQDCELIQRLVEEAVSAHGGDVAATLATFGGDEQVEDTYGGTLALNAERPITTVERPRAAPSLAQETIQAVEETPGRYSQLGEHARGGMGKVLLVHDEFLGRDVALKELLPLSVDIPLTQQSPVLQSMSFLSRFLQEARITGQLEHPSIVPVYELGRRKDNTLYYTMKLVRGQTLANAIRGCDSLEERLRLLPHFVDLCQAIAYAHSRDVIHRDIKPANVMVGEFGETVVLDWGLAKVKDAEDAHAEGLQETLRLMNLGDEAALEKTQYGQLLGTPVYAPPEQLKGQLDQIDERSDVYSLGAVLYQLLTGHPPFFSTSLREIVRQVLEDQPRSIEDFAPDAPPELMTICANALNKTPSDRYASASALAEEVQRFQSGALVHAHEYRTRDLVKRFFKRNRLALSMGAIAITIFIAGGIVSFIQLAKERDRAISARVREASARDEAEYQAYIAKMQIAQAHFTNGDYRMTLKALRTAPEAFRHWEWGYLKGQCEPFESRLEGRGGLIPKSDLIYTVSSPSMLKIWSASDKTLLHEIEVELNHRALDVNGWPLDRYAVKVSSTLDRLGLLTIDDKVLLYDLDVGRIIRTIEHRQPINGFGFSPNGQSLFTLNQDDITKIDVMDGRTIAQYEAPGDAMFGAVYWPRKRVSPFVRLSDAGAVSIANLEELDDRVPIYDYSEQFSLYRTSEYLILHEENQPPEYWDLNARVRVSVLEGLESGWTGDTSSDRECLYTLSKSNLLQQWELATGTLRRNYRGNPETLSELNVSPDNRYVLCYGEEDTAFLWDVEHSEPLCELSGHAGSILSAQFSKDGQIIVTGSTDSNIRIWSVPDGRLLRVLRGHTAPVDSLQFTSDGITLISASGKSEVIAWPVDPPVQVNMETIDAHRINFSADGQLLEVNGRANRASILSASDGHAVAEFVGAASTPYPSVIALSEDSRQIAIGLNDNGGVIALWNANEGRLTAILEGHQGVIRDLEFSSDAHLVVSASFDRTVKVWSDSSDSILLQELKHDAGLMSIDLDSSGRHLVTATETGSVTLWNTDTWDSEWTTSLADSRITKIEFVDHLNLIVAASDDGSIVMLDRNGEIIRRLSAHTGAVNDFDISSDKQRLLTAGADGSVKNWDFTRNTLVNSLPFRDTNVLLARLVSGGQNVCVVAQGLPPMTTKVATRVPATPSTSPTLDQSVQWIRNLSSSDSSAIVCFWTADELERAVAFSYLGLPDTIDTARASDRLIVQKGPSLLGRLGLRMGDVITEVDSTPLIDQTSLKERLVQFVGSNDVSVPLALTAHRNSRTIACKLFLIEPFTREVDAPIPKAIFKAAVPMALNLLDKQFGEGIQQQQIAADAMSIPLEAIPGIYVPEQSPAVNAYLGLIHVQPGDFILSFAGEPTRTLDDFRAIALSVVDGVNEGEIDEAEMVIARGIYHRLRVRMRLE